MSVVRQVPQLSEEERTEKVKDELNRRIDLDLAVGHVTPAQEDFHVLDRYSAYLSFRAAEDYRRAVLSLSLFLAGVTVVSVLVSARIL